ncbi:MAG TPA: acetate kinase [Candidatus Veblenbacteria bacterium]|nr:MAG: Acetate kinase [Parcubacteria group bacterium GW2011_GWE2_43_12]HBZ36598.1 acetate kinase [Candidatus Veblenbacteria bacterium]
MKLKDKSSYILVFNAGSATLKWALYEEDGLVEAGRGTVERIGERGSFAEWRLFGKLSVKQLKFSDHKQAVGYIVKMLAWHKLLGSISLVGHRIVYGGQLFIAPVKLTKEVINRLEKLPALAPLHNPVELAVAKAASKLLPKVKQIAEFDTAWFAHLPLESQTYALPRLLNKKYGLKKYGFHGLSHNYVTNEAARILGKKTEQVNLVTCHLGSGSSVAAVRAGKPIDTSMGFTPLAGLVMCTRAGDIDPGLLLYLAKQPGFSIKKLDQLLNHESGLKGMTGVADMREVLTMAGYEVLGFRVKKLVSASDRQQAKLALKVYLYNLQKYIGAYAAILGRVDAIVFTGGIGERNEVVRNLTMQGLPTLKNVSVLAIPTNEELAIARQIINN